MALNIRDDTNTLRDLKDELEPNMEYTVKQHCGFFVRVAHETVFLVHETAREFLLRYQADAARSGLWHSSLNLPDSNGTLAKACTRLLSLEEWSQTSETAIRRAGRLDNTATRVSLTFYNYAAQNWFHHVETSDKSAGNEDAELRQIIKKLCNHNSPRFKRWWCLHEQNRNHWRVVRTRFPMESCINPYYAHFAAADGNWSIIRGLADDDFGVLDHNVAGIDILVAASMMGQEHAVRWILNKFDHATMQVEAALMGALVSLRSNPETIQLLIDTGLDLNKQYRVPSAQPDSGEMTLPIIAAISGPTCAQKLEVVCRNGAKVDDDVIATVRAKTATLFADCLEVLFRFDRRPIADRMPGLQDALEFATRQGLPRARKLVLQQCPDVPCHVDIAEGLVPAAGQGNDEHVEELLLMGAQDRTGEALREAAMYGNAEIAELLLNAPRYSYPQAQTDEALRVFCEDEEGVDSFIARNVQRNFVGSRGLHDVFDIIPHIGKNAETNSRFVSLLLDHGATLSRSVFHRSIVRRIAFNDDVPAFMITEMHRLQRDVSGESLQAADYFTLACLWGEDAPWRRSTTLAWISTPETRLA